MNQEKFIRLVQRRIAITSIGASTARKMGPPGTIDKVRAALIKLNLKKFSSLNANEFKRLLDIETDGLKKKLPKEARHFGSCRKFLNIFLRGVLYNRFLYKYYNLSRIEPWLEIPVDSYVYKGLLSEQGSRILPKWNGVVKLTIEENKKFQDFAKSIALKKNTIRINLDLLYWRNQQFF